VVVKQHNCGAAGGLVKTIDGGGGVNN